MMGSHSNMSGRAHRLTLALIPAAALAVTLAACSGSGSSTPQHTTKRQTTAPAAAAQATSAPASAAAAVSGSALSGTWHGQYSGAYQGTFVLHWTQTGSKLNGRIHISNPPSVLPIHGTLTGSSIKFGTVGSYRITYSGTVSGGSMSGTWSITGAGQGGNWSASKG
jgi:hypothetical protein